MKPGALTAIVPILEDRLSVLTTHLAQVGADPANNSDIPFGRSPLTHFARWAILPPRYAAGGGETTLAGPQRLLFSACYDGGYDLYLTELCATLGVGMEPIWQCCAGYQPGAAADPTRFAAFLKPYSYQPGIFLIAFPDLTAAQIIRSEQLQIRVESSLDAAATAVPPTGNPPPPAHPANPPVDTTFPPAGLFTRLMTWVVNQAVGVQPGVIEPNADVATAPALTELEDVFVQNQMTAISRVRPGFWPRLALRMFLFLGSVFGGAKPGGKLSGLTTIHFARWVPIDSYDALLFESNYDGSWERYIDDFGDNAANGMNAVWGTSVGYPKGGCLDIEAFKKVIRSHQHPTQVFYSAYPNQTVRNIANNRTLSLPLAPDSPFARGVYS